MGWLLLAPAVAVLSACQGLGTTTASTPATSGAEASAPAPANASAASPAGVAAADSLVVEPSGGYASLYQAIAAATTSIDLVMYELSDPQAEELLAQASGRRVNVRVILDQAYAKSENESAYTYLVGHGVAVHWSSTHVDITHQKTLVVDGREALIMTGNLTPQYYSTTRDFIVVDTDARDVAAIGQTFDADFDDASAVPSAADDLVWSPGSEAALAGIISGASSELLVENEEMADPVIVSALEGAARRGVNVEVCMTYSSSWSSEFSELSQAGVHIRTYSPDASLYIHAKAILADPDRGSEKLFVGSENFSDTSLLHNRELGIMVGTPAIVTQMEAVLSQDFEGGTPTA